MNKPIVMALAAVLAGLVCADPASAQNITKVYGDGQLAKPFQNFSQMAVRVTDSSGNPQANVAVTWAITVNFNAQLNYGSTTTTDNNGNTYNSLFRNIFQGVAPARRYAVMASIPNGAFVTFNLTESLQVSNTSQAGAVQVLSGPFLQSLLAGDLLTGQAGSTGSTPITVSVYDQNGGGAIQNVSVQLVSEL